MTGVVVPVATEIGAVPDTLVTVPPLDGLVLVIVIAPAPLLILIPVPAVKVALVRVFPVVLPINNSPFI